MSQTSRRPRPRPRRAPRRLPRPRPLEEKTAWLEAKFDGLVDLVLESAPYSKIYVQFEKNISGMVGMAEKMGTMLMCQKRKSRDKQTRLPSEVWHLILTEFGGWDPKQHQDSIPMFSRINKPAPESAESIWYTYTTEIDSFKKKLEHAEACRDTMKRFINIL